MITCLQISQNELIKTHQCLSLTNQSSSEAADSTSQSRSVLQHQNPPRHVRSQTNGTSPSQIDQSTLQSALRWPSCSFSDIQTFMFAESSTDSYTHSHTQIQTRTARYPAQRPLTWTCCSHSATHKSLGSQRHCWPSVPCWTWLHGNKNP